jgi:acyl-CoA thioester hydrolase
MPKPDPLLLDPARYPFQFEITPRFTDVDVNLHINNVALVGLLQESRVRFHDMTAFPYSASGVTSMVAHFAIDYLGEGLYPDPLTVHIGAIAIGRTSHTLGQLAVQQGQLIAYAQTVLVCVDDHKPTQNTPQFLEAVEPWMLKQ